MYEIAQEEFNKARLISEEINIHNKKNLYQVQSEYRFILLKRKKNIDVFFSHLPNLKTISPPEKD